MDPKLNEDDITVLLAKRLTTGSVGGGDGERFGWMTRDSYKGVRKPTYR